ncbi:MAG: T9SS type A sorting domain-containing protein [Flavobacteriales bacterium]|nr:T9SS type A sorting domain-containing protein [Flavobacteriales bacterium]MCB9190169.1 T9SS type A sorting domain-containing protein [Flavobacteriales bacterium]
MKATLFSALLLCASSCIFAQSGTIDLDFDGDGFYHYYQTDQWGYGAACAYTSSGKALLAGYSLDLSGGNRYIHVNSLNPDGSLDLAFGNLGTASIDHPTDYLEASSMLVQPDGKILVAGKLFLLNPSWSDFFIARLNPNGMLDLTFGTNGFFSTSIGVFDEIKELTLQADGKIVVVGLTYEVFPITASDLVVARLNENGTLDQSFSFDGKLTLDLNDRDYANAVAINSAGNIIVAGASYDDVASEEKGFVVSYNSDGTIDNSFATNGIRLTNYSTGDALYGLDINSEDRIVVAGSSDVDGSSVNFMILRLNPDGTNDVSFSADGLIMVDFAGSTDIGRDVIIQPDGKVLVGGSVGNSGFNGGLVRFQANGLYDTSFGTNGKAMFSDGTDSNTFEKIHLQSDGKILAAGSSTAGSPPIRGANMARIISGINIGIGEVDAYIGSTLVYPNPITNNQVTVKYDLKSDEMVSIELFDLSGKMIAQLQPNTRQVAGSYQKTLTLPELSAGNYLLNLNTEKGSVSVKVLAD